MNPDNLQPTNRDAPAQQLDFALIRALQLDGRASIRELAQTLGTSRDVVSQRLKYLTQHGDLRITAALDPDFSGDHILVHVRAETNGSIYPAATQIAALPDVVFASATSGTQALTFESRHRDTQDLHSTLEYIRSFAGIRKLQVSTYIEVLRGFYVAPQHSDITVDPIDLKLITMLQHNGRTSFRDLASSVHLSPSTVRARVNRLVDGGVIQISAINVGGISSSSLATGLGISTSSDSDELYQHLSHSPDVDFAVRSYGSYDFIATVVGTSSKQFNAMIDHIRSIPGVTAVDSWAHFEILKEEYTRSTEHLTPTQDPL